MKSVARGPASVISLVNLGEGGAFVQELKSLAGGTATGDILDASQGWSPRERPVHTAVGVSGTVARVLAAGAANGVPAALQRCRGRVPLIHKHIFEVKNSGSTDKVLHDHTQYRALPEGTTESSGVSPCSCPGLSSMDPPSSRHPQNRFRFCFFPSLM